LKPKFIILKKTNKVKHSLAGPPLEDIDRRSKEEYEIHKNFKYARMFPKRQFHLQLKKKNTKKLDFLLSPNPKYNGKGSRNLAVNARHTLSDFKLTRKTKSKMRDFSRMATQTSKLSLEVSPLNKY